MVKIAVASTDGLVVNQHFGRADTFYIVEAELETKNYVLVEKRHTEPVCHGGDHEEDQMKQSVNHLSDCDYVLVSRIGLRARNELERLGIEAYEIPGLIGESVDKMIRYLKVQSLLSTK